MVVGLAFTGGLEIGVSTEILNEYRRVLERPRFKISTAKLDGFFSQLEAQAKLVHPLHGVGASPDESDNRFLECAESFDAEFLITGNNRHFPEVWKRTKIVNAREFLEQVVPL
jgi:uncharacterized protein